VSFKLRAGIKFWVGTSMELLSELGCLLSNTDGKFCILVDASTGRRLTSGLVTSVF